MSYETFHFMCNDTGEVCTNLRTVISSMVCDLKHYIPKSERVHYVLSWRYSRRGF